jgi:undecaprenyl-diphosphatase
VGAADGLGNWAFKKTFQRPRPPETQNLVVTVRAPFGGYSFISNHATNMFALATYTTAFFPAMAIPAFTVATLVAYSRVYNGVHFPSDVLAGALFGALVGLVISKLCKKILKKLNLNIFFVHFLKLIF